MDLIAFERVIGHTEPQTSMEKDEISRCSFPVVP